MTRAQERKVWQATRVALRLIQRDTSFVRDATGRRFGGGLCLALERAYRKTCPRGGERELTGLRAKLRKLKRNQPWDSYWPYWWSLTPSGDRARFAAITMLEATVAVRKRPVKRARR